MPTATYSLLEKSGTAAIIGEWLPGVVLVVSIGVGRCSDLGGGDIFFKQQKCDFLEEQCLHAIWSTILQ